MIFVKTFFRYLSFISNARFERVLFYYAEWQNAYRQLQYDACVKEKEEKDGGGGEKITQDCVEVTKKKNIIEFREELPRPEDYTGTQKKSGLYFDQTHLYVF